MPGITIKSSTNSGNRRRSGRVVIKKLRKSIGKLRHRRRSSSSKKENEIPKIQLTQSNETADDSVSCASSAMYSPAESSSVLDLHKSLAFDDDAQDHDASGYVSETSFYTGDESAIEHYETEDEYSLLDDISVSTRDAGEVETSLMVDQDHHLLGKTEDDEEEEQTLIGSEESSLLVGVAQLSSPTSKVEDNVEEDASLTSITPLGDSLLISTFTDDVSTNDKEAPIPTSIETILSGLSPTSTANFISEFELPEDASHDGQTVSPEDEEAQSFSSPGKTTGTESFRSSPSGEVGEGFRRSVSFSSIKDVMFSPNTIVQVPEEQSVYSAMTEPSTTATNSFGRPCETLSPTNTDQKNENTLSIFRDLHSSEIIYEDKDDDSSSDQEDEELLQITFTPSEDMMELVEAVESKTRTEAKSMIAEKKKGAAAKSVVVAQSKTHEEKPQDLSVTFWRFACLLSIVATAILVGHQHQIGTKLIGRSADSQAMKLEAQRERIQNKKDKFLHYQQNTMGAWL